MATTESEESKKVGLRAPNPYKQGSRAYQMYESNPYTQDTFTRKHTWWDTFVEDMGLRSGYESAQDEWLAAGRAYDAQIAEIDAADKYNSEAAKAARMKEAGLNPDLTGLQGASEAEEFANREAAPNPNVNEPTFKVANLIDNIGKTFMGVISMSKEIAGGLGLLEDLKTKKIGNAEKLEKLVDDFLQGYVPEKGKTGNENKVNLYGTLVTESDKYASNYGLTKKQKDQFWNAISARLESKPGEIYERDVKNLQSRRQWGLMKGSKYSTTSDDITTVTEIVGELTHNLDIVLFNEARVTKAKQNYEIEYNNNRDGSTIAQGEAAEAGAAKEKANMQKKVREAIDQSSQALAKAAKQGNWFALILESLLPGLYLKFAE